LGLMVTVTSRGNETVLPDEVRTVLYRIAQESITNVIRHAKADSANVVVAFSESEVRIRVEDNGCGFDVDATFNKTGHPCWGLLGLKERAALVSGECVIISKPAVGTIIEVSVPLEKETHG
jgi:two-component system sensor histidine kinase UhpB